MEANDNIKDNTQDEKRSLDGDSFIIRMSDKENREIEGYGIVFNKRFKLWSNTYEEIAPEAGAYFKQTGIDVLSCFNHNFDKVLGRTLSNSMRFEVDKTGVKYIVKVAETSYGDDLLKSVERGDVRGSSFMFRTKVTEWIEEDENSIRRIKEFSQVREMGPVVNPAYVDTTVAKRSLDDFKQQKEKSKGEAESVEVIQNRYQNRARTARVAYYKTLN